MEYCVFVILRPTYFNLSAFDNIVFFKYFSKLIINISVKIEFP
jgi:hypothetical protein